MTERASVCESLRQTGEKLVEAVAAEHAARREGRWNEWYETATASASMVFELALVEARDA